MPHCHLFVSCAPRAFFVTKDISDTVAYDADFILQMFLFKTMRADMVDYRYQAFSPIVLRIRACQSRYGTTIVEPRLHARTRQLS